jgi:primase-polymerase (primpol)-like protein
MSAAAVFPSAPSFAIPDDLAELDRFLLWRFESVQGRETKVPYSVRGYKASSMKPRDWASYDVAYAAWRRNPSRYAGIGFVFVQGDGISGIDLDDCLTGQREVKPWAQGIIERFADTYMEISPSGTGVKIWARGSLPANLPGVKVGDGQIEIYDHARFFTLTGRAFRGAPLQVEDHAGDLLLLYERLKGNRKGWALQPLQGGRIPYGQQHNTLVSIIGTLRARRVCDEAIEACVLAVNEHQCERPGPPEHIVRMVRSSRPWGAR